MIEKPKRPKKIPNQDNKQPQTIEQLIKRYDLDNTKIYDFLDELVGNINRKNTYSTEEQIVGRWIDGRLLYRKVIIGAVPIANGDGAYTTAQYDVAENIDPYVMIIENAWIVDTAEGTPNLCPLPYVLHAGEVNVDVKHLTINGKYAITNSLGYFNNTPFVAIIKYTKTTD